MENANSHDYLHKIKSTVIENIRRTGKPSVEAFTTIPNNELQRGMDSDDEDEMDDLDADENPDKRVTQRQRDQEIEHNGELYEASDDEDYKESLGVRRQPGVKRRRNILDFQNPHAERDDDTGTPNGVRGLNGESARSTHQPSPAPHRSRTNTPAVPGADEDGDVEMDEAEAEAAGAVVPEPTTAEAAPSRSRSPAGVVTPPESPPLAPATADTTGDVDMEAEEEGDEVEEKVKEKEEGEAERDTENVKGEVRTEVAKED